MKKSKSTSFTLDTLKITTYNHKVGQKHFSFDYKVFINDKLYSNKSYDTTHSRSPATIRKYLKNGYATNLVLDCIDLTEKIQ